MQLLNYFKYIKIILTKFFNIKLFIAHYFAYLFWDIIYKGCIFYINFNKILSNNAN